MPLSLKKSTKNRQVCQPSNNDNITTITHYHTLNPSIKRLMDAALWELRCFIFITPPFNSDYYTMHNASKKQNHAVITCPSDCGPTCSESSRMSHSSPHKSSMEMTPEIVVSNVANSPICGDKVFYIFYFGRFCGANPWQK